ncbi:MAG: hypothetical protein KC656_13850 [Myxococcales bacterium]|nr:hypothetical protein [Myxococcales bacterium]MCB9670192.1 hypothetical protein [Alphaproteobacteria bacterium]MCB9695046.1 hypothetical protein [Alphaproteobacteria bacterium]
MRNVRRSFAVGVALATVLLGTAGKMDKLADYERDHYSALVVWFEDEKKETKAWLKLKTPEERDQWLKDNGYWNHFYKHSEEERAEILGREPKIGWTQDMVYMAWGAPYRKTKSTKRTAQNTTILTYRMQVTPDGRHLIYIPNSKATYKAVDRYSQELVLDDEKVTEIRRKEGWE